MGVIQYRRGERFDRVIVSKNEDTRASNMVVRLNTHTFKIPESMVRTAPASPTSPVSSPLPEDRSLAAVLKRAVEASAQQSTNPTVRDIFNAPVTDAANRTREEAEKIWADVAAKSKEGVKNSPIKFFIIAFVVFQILRAIFSE